MKAEGFASLAEAPEWWLMLIILYDRLKLIKIALSDMQSKVYLLRKQDLRLAVLQK